ncbi:MAG: hypothetical protein II840_11395 [Kiritimatiellae bacterium]|nr:hypothetical protein [Kiritimatiellia bacterium]
MKKLITIMAAAASALFAFGDVTLPSGTSLEGLTVGEQLDPTTASDDAGTGTFSTYWFLAGDSQADLLVTNYVDAPYTPRPEQFSGDNNKYLRIETSGRLYRSIGANDQTAVTNFSAASIGNGIYLDTLVQFTPAEDAFGAEALSTGDKIAIEYVEREDDPSTELVNEACTNFVICAGYIVDDNETIPTNYFATVPAGFNKEDWHRLTVRAVASIAASGAQKAGFIVYLDGVALEYSTDVECGDGFAPAPAVAEYYKADCHAIYPSAVQNGTAQFTLSAVAFNGNGCVDDISFTDQTPGFIGRTVTFDLGTGDAVTTLTVAGIDYDVAGVATTNIENLVESFTIAVTLAENYNIDVITNFEGCTYASTTPTSGTVTITAASATVKVLTTRDNFDYIDENGDPQTAVTLADAFANVGDGATITLKFDYVLADWGEAGVTYDIDGKAVTLDLHGNTIEGGTGEEDTELFYVEAGAVLTVIDSVGGGEVNYVTDYGIFFNEGDLFIGLPTGDEGATFNGTLFATDAEGEVIRGSFDVANNDDSGSFLWEDCLGDDSTAALNQAETYWVVTPQQIIGTYTVTVTPNANATYAAAYNDGGAAVEFVNDVAAVTVGKTITITATPGSGYEYAETPAGWTAGQDGEITIEVSAEATVAIPAPTAVSSSDLDPAGNTPVEIEAESEVAATNAVQLVTPTGVDPAAYKDLFDFTVTPVVPGVKYEVEIAGIKESVELAVEESAMDVLDGKLGAKVQVPAGLNYKITTYETLGGSAVNTTSGQSDGTGVSVSKPGDTQGFIKIEMATVPFN